MQHLHRLTPRKRRAFPTTETELKLIAMVPPHQAFDRFAGLLILICFFNTLEPLAKALGNLLGNLQTVGADVSKPVL
jgi:hypothetical protein